MGSKGEQIQLTYDDRSRVVERRVQRPGFRAQTWRYDWNGLDQLVGYRTPDGARSTMVTILLAAACSSKNGSAQEVST